MALHAECGACALEQGAVHCGVYAQRTAKGQVPSGSEEGQFASMTPDHRLIAMQAGPSLPACCHYLPVLPALIAAAARAHSCLLPPELYHAQCAQD